MALPQGPRHVHEVYVQYGWTRTPPAQATSYQLPATSYQLYSNVLQPLLQLLLRLCVEGLPQLFQIKFHGSQMLMQLQIDIVQLLYIYRYVGAVHMQVGWQQFRGSAAVPASTGWWQPRE